MVPFFGRVSYFWWKPGSFEYSVMRHWNLFFKNFIGVQLLYRVCSFYCTGKWINYVYTCNPSFLDFLSIWVTSDRWVEFPALYGRFSLVIYFTHGSVYLSTPISQFILIPAFSPWCPHICSLCLCLYFCFAKWCFWILLEKTLESPLDCKEIKPVNPKGNQFWIFIGRTDAEAETPILWPPDTKNWLNGKDSDAGKDWRQEEKGTTEDEMVGWHHWLDGHEFEQALGVGDGQGSLGFCSPWSHKELDMTERLIWIMPFMLFL